VSLLVDLLGWVLVVLGVVIAAGYYYVLDRSDPR
jgi:hypothetical protein